MKKIIAIVLALALILASCAVAFADGEDSATTTTSTWRGTADGSISITNLQKGDSVNFYQVFAYSDDARTTGSWIVKSPFSLSADEINKILALGDYASPDGSKKDQAGIDAALGGKIAGQVTSAATKKNAIADDEGVATTTADPGLYVALVTPADPTYIYNPIFVGSDYYTNDSGVWALTADMSYSNEALAKVETMELTKEIVGDTDIKYDVNIGDDVDFVIDSYVPAYSTVYQNPTYVITDNLDEQGLVVKADTTPVVTITDIDAIAGTDYVVAVAENRKSFTVTMTAAGLKKVQESGTAKAIKVTYTATVTELDAGDVNITEKDNKATVKFSNNPDDKDSFSLLEDKTRTYSFSLDANLLGNSEWENTEVVKIGLDKDGKEITQTTYNNGFKAGKLPGAKFGLYTNFACTSAYSNGISGVNYEEIESDINGKLNISGLDAGTYYLKEISAPNGYIKSDSVYKIVITANYVEMPDGYYETQIDNRIVKVYYEKYKVLKDYNVEVFEIEKDKTEEDAIKLSKTDFTITNSGNAQDITTTAAQESSNTGAKLKNTQGVELPSTGGIGTTIFYILGGLLVVGAAVILVARRKASN